MDDAFNKYPTITLAHSEEDLLVSSIRNKNINFPGEFVYYNGFRGPIKIWDVRNIPENIVEQKGFYAPFSGNFSEFDNFEFVRQ